MIRSARTSFRRYYYAQVGKEAVIIDERFNGGGMLASDIVEHLQRRMLSLVASRDGDDEVQPRPNRKARGARGRADSRRLRAGPKLPVRPAGKVREC